MKRTFPEAQYDLNQHIRKIQSVETEKSIKNERLKYLQQRELAIQNQFENEKRILERNEAEVTVLRSQRKQVAESLRIQEEQTLKLKSDLEVLKSKNAEQQQTTRELETEHREVEQEAQGLVREREVKRVQIQSLEGELSRAEEDKNQRFIDLDAFGSKAQELESETQTLEKQVTELVSREEQHKRDLEGTEKQVNELKDKVYKTNRLLDAKQNEYNLTKSLVENLEGFPESVKFLKKNAKWDEQSALIIGCFCMS